MSYFYTIQKRISDHVSVSNIFEKFKNDYIETCLYFSQLAYFSYTHICKRLTKLGATYVSIYDTDGIRAFLVTFDTCIVISFRGHEINKWYEIINDLKFWTTTRNGCKVHSGFASSLSEISKRLLFDLDNEIDKESDQKHIIYTGHSLGGALAMIMALEYSPDQICTFGSPRSIYAHDENDIFNEIDITRVYDENDFIANLPPTFSGYNHIGNPVVLRGLKGMWDSHKLTSYLDGILCNDKEI